MQNTLIKISASVLCFAGLISPALANNGYESSGDAPPSTTSSQQHIPPVRQSAVSNGYSISPGQPSMTTGTSHMHHDNGYSSSASDNDGYSSSNGSRHHGNHHQPPFWIAMHNGEPIPTNAVAGGSQYNPNAMFYVCRAHYRGGVHPGKFLGGNCNISWGGREVTLQNYEVLVSDTPLNWVESSHGVIPRHAVEGGREQHRKLFICQAEYENGTHPGKIVGKNCNFGWGGREITMHNYRVLTS